MRKFLFATVIVAGLVSCNDNADNDSESTADSISIENQVDTSATMQTDTMQKGKVDTAANSPKKSGKGR